LRVLVEAIVGKVLVAEAITAWGGGKVLESRVSDWSILLGVEVETRFRAASVLPATAKADQERRAENDDE
jgi:hypothetical protein